MALKITMTGQQLADVLVHVRCLRQEEYVRIWGQRVGEHLWHERGGDAAKLITSLDLWALDKLVAYLVQRQDRLEQELGQQELGAGLKHCTLKYPCCTGQAVAYDAGTDDYVCAACGEARAEGGV